MKYKRDYKIIIEADSNDVPFWNVFRKGEKSLATKDDLQVISEMLGEVKICIDEVLKSENDDSR